MQAVFSMRANPSHRHQAQDSMMRALRQAKGYVLRGIHFLHSWGEIKRLEDEMQS